MAATRCACGNDLGSPSANRDLGLHPWWGAVAASAFVFGWITYEVIDAKDVKRGSTGTGFGYLPLIIEIVAYAGAGALVGLWFSIARPLRKLASLLAATFGGFAIGVVFGLLWRLANP